MIEPAQSDDELLADIRTGNPDGDGLRVWWLGQSGFLLQWNGSHLLFDPYLSESLTKKYADTDKPHVRMTKRPIDPQQLDMIDVITSSHNHTDHLDAETLQPLLRSNPQAAMVVPAANRDFAAERLGQPASTLTVLDAAESTSVKGFQLHAVPAAHEQLDRNEQGQFRYVGYVVEFGPWTVYHSGDTIRYDGMDEILRRWQIDIAFLPINGSLPERRVSGNLWGREAAELAKDIGAKLTIPCHYEMFQFNTVSTDEFRTAADELGIRVAVLQCGERFDAPLNEKTP
jgi:L-ascorbate metabolism protein UlaG (beta-lactamase superfamily)